MNNNQYIWLIGGSIMAEPMCKEIKRRGYRLLLTDGGYDCHCRPHADFFQCISVYDIKGHLYFASSIKATGSFRIAAVLTIGTDAGPTVSALSEYFGLPGIGRQTAERVKDKIQMRRAVNFAEPYTYIHYEGASIGYFPPDKFPLVVKAPDQAGSRGLEVARHNDEVKEILARRSGTLLIEEKLQGDDIYPVWRKRFDFDTSEAAFDFFIEDGQVIYANGALRMFWTDRPGIEAGHVNPFPADRRIMEIATNAANLLGVTWGPFKIDLMKDKRYGWTLLECATRLSGGFDHMYTSPLATGRDVTGVMLDVALGGKVDHDKLANTLRGYAVCLAPCYEAGDLLHWQEPDTMRYDHLFILQRQAIRPLVCNQDRPAFIICHSNLLPDVALDKCRGAANYLRPVYKERIEQ